MIELKYIITNFMISGILGSILYLSLPPIILDDKFKNFDIKDELFQLQSELNYQFPINIIEKFFFILDLLINCFNYSCSANLENSFPLKYKTIIFNNNEQFHEKFLYFANACIKYLQCLSLLNKDNNLVLKLKQFLNDNTFPQYSDTIHGLDKNFYHFINLMFIWNAYDFYEESGFFECGDDLILMFYSLEIIDYDLLLSAYYILSQGNGKQFDETKTLELIKQQVNEFINKYKDYPIVKNDTRLNELLNK